VCYFSCTNTNLGSPALVREGMAADYVVSHLCKLKGAIEDLIASTDD